MNDVVGALQSGKSLRTKQSMSIGDNADDRPGPRRGRCLHLCGRAKLGSNAGATHNQRYSSGEFTNPILIGLPKT